MSSHYLSDEKIQYYKQKLKDNILSKQKLTDKAFHEAMHDNEKTSDIADQGSQFETQSNNIALGNHGKIILARMKKALEEFDTEEFGYCVTCGIEIGEKRLDIDPSVDKCLECQEITEKKSHLYS